MPIYAPWNAFDVWLHHCVYVYIYTDSTVVQYTCNLASTSNALIISEVSEIS